MIIESKGDALTIFDTKCANVLLHGANCKGIMGAGIAAQIATKYPHVDALDTMNSVLGHAKPGTVFPVLVNEGWVVNCYTQDLPGPNAKVGWVEECLTEVVRLFPESNIVMPMIGCGIGGLGEGDVLDAVQWAFKSHRGTLIVVNEFVKNLLPVYSNIQF